MEELILSINNPQLSVTLARIATTLMEALPITANNFHLSISAITSNQAYRNRALLIHSLVAAWRLTTSTSKQTSTWRIRNLLCSGNKSMLIEEKLEHPKPQRQADQIRTRMFTHLTIPKILGWPLSSMGFLIPRIKIRNSSSEWGTETPWSSVTFPLTQTVHTTL